MPPARTPFRPSTVALAAGDLLACFLAAWAELQCPAPWRRVVVAVSGGPDSLALLHLMHASRQHHRLDLVVGHVDHGIHPDSGVVADRVVAAASTLGLPVAIGRLGLGPGTSETRARAARHAWLEDLRRREGADGIVLAHHQDDQVETILLRVLAGSGPAGLAGMAARQHTRLRPLLGFRKQELIAWLDGKGISGWNDPANGDPVHDRSWIRGVVLPLLMERDAQAGERLLRLGRQAAENRGAWNAALVSLPGLVANESEGRISVAALPLATYDSALAVALLQAAARRVGCTLGIRRGRRLLEMARRGRSGAVMELGGRWRGELAFGRICLYEAVASPGPVRLEGRGGQVRWGQWQVSWSRGPAPGAARRDGWVGWFIGEGALLRAPVPGDQLAPLGGVGHRPVARLLQEARVARSRREAWPLVEVEGNIAWVGGICRGDRALPREGEDALRIEVSGG